MSQELLLRFYDHWNLEILAWNVCCLERDTKSWNWKSLSKKKNLPWNEEFIEQYQDYLDWDNLSRNEGLPWSESLIEKFIDHWNWSELSGNEVLPWSQKLIEKFKSKWNWELFSENNKLPWNMVWGKEYLERYKDVYDPEPLDFIERFMDESNHWTSIQINDWCIEQNELYWQVWTNLSKNELLPWSHQLFDRYEDRWNIKSVASHYDGNVRSLTLEQVDRLILLASSEAVESPSQEQPSPQTPVHENPSLSQMPKAKGERLSSDLMFDEEAYAKAKPLFEAGLAHFKDVAKDVREFMRLLIRELLDRSKDPSLVRNMKPYIVKFIEDQQNQQNQALEKIKV